MSDRNQYRGEEIANSVSHGVGLLAAIAEMPVLILAAVSRGDPAGIVGASVFAANVTPGSVIVRE